MTTRRLLLVIGSAALLGVGGIALGVDVKFPKRARASVVAIVDELGNTLFGTTPGRVEVTNFPGTAGATREVVVDANGMVVGDALHVGDAVYATGSSPSGVQYAIPLTTLGLGIGSGEVYYPSLGCSGASYVAGATFVGLHVRAVETQRGTGTLYVPREVGAQQDIVNGSVLRLNGDCTSPWSGRSSTVTLSYDTVDVSQLQPPLRLAAQ